MKSKVAKASIIQSSSKFLMLCFRTSDVKGKSVRSKAYMQKTAANAKPENVATALLCCFFQAAQ